MFRRRSIGGWFVIALLLTLGGTGQALAYPDRPIRLVVGFPPGGPVDFVARTLQNPLSEALGQAVVIENKGGADATIAADEVARAQPDGHTLLLVYERHAIANIFYKTLKYDALDSFDYVSLIGYSPLVVLASRDSGIQTLDQFVQAAKAEPGKINWGTSGPGVGETLKSELLQQALGTSVTYVPFNGSAPSMSALAAGQIDLTIASLSSAAGILQSNRVRALAVGSDKRVPQLPGVPSIDEYAKGVELTAWIGLVGPKGMPAGAKSAIEAAVGKALADSAVRQVFAKNGFVSQGLGSAPFLEKARADKQGALDLIKARALAVQ